jgi:hypothetical protein
MSKVLEAALLDAAYTCNVTINPLIQKRVSERANSERIQKED